MIATFVRKTRDATKLVKERGLAQYCALVLRRHFPKEFEWLSVKSSKLIIAGPYWIWRVLNPRTRVVFITFADGQEFTSARLAAQVSALEVFDEIICYSPSMLPEDFRARHEEHLRQARGFGFWVWKPHIILQTLKALNRGDILVYADAGCTAVAKSGHVMKKFLLELDASDEGLMVTANPYSSFITKHWVKADLLAHFGYLDNEHVLNSRLVEANRIALVKTEENMRLIEQWSQIASNMHLIDDSPSIFPNDATFVEHRHDQSIFSLLIWNRNYLTGLERIFDATRSRETF